MTEQPHNPLEGPASSPDLTIPLDDGRDEQVTIGVIHHKKPGFLSMCLQSIHICSHLSNYEVVVVDNGSNDAETDDYLNVIESEGIKVIRNKENKYWSAACNQVVARADPRSSYFVFLHADTVVLNPAWLDILINISVSRNAGMVGVQLNEYYVQKQKVQFIQEWCMLVSRKCWEDIGPWPEELPLVGNAFIMTLRAQFQGHKPQATSNNIVHHYKSFSGNTNEYEQMTEDAMAKIPKLMQQAQS